MVSTLTVSTLIFGSDLSPFQSSLYIGINIQNVLYGMVLFLYWKNIHSLLRNTGAYKKSNPIYVLFSSVSAFLITIWIVVLTTFGQKIWISDPDFPGGPGAFLKQHMSDWYVDCAMIATFLLQLMTDGLMIHRCYIIWNNYRVIVLPIILWVLILTFSIATWVTCSLGGGLYTSISATLCLSYISSFMFLNMTTTALMCFRLVSHGLKIQKELGREYASIYFSIVTIIVDSALPLTLSCIVLQVLLCVKSPASPGFLCVHMMTTAISPQLLILRTIQRRTQDHAGSIHPRSAIRFNDDGTLQVLDNNEARTNSPPTGNQDLPNARGEINDSPA